MCQLKIRNAFGYKQINKNKSKSIVASKDWSLIFSCNKKCSCKQAVLGWQPLKEVIEDQGPLHLSVPSLLNGFCLHGCKMAIIPLGIKLKKKEGQRTKGAYYFSGLIKHFPRSPIWLFWLRRTGSHSHTSLQSSLGKRVFYILHLYSLGR